MKRDSTYKSDKEIAYELYTSWLNSPPHRKNMEGENYYQIGVGFSYNSSNGKFYGAQVFSALGYNFDRR